MRVLLLVCCALLLLGTAAACSGQETPSYVIPAGTPAHIRRAVESPERTAEQRARKMVFAPGTRGSTDQALFIFRKPN